MSTYSPNLRVELIGTGDQAGTWGTTTNSNFAYVFETAIAGYQTVSVISADQALTYTNGPVASPALNQSVYAMLRLTTTTTAPFNVYAPPVSKQYIIWNNSGYASTIYNSTVIGNTTAAGTGVTIANGDIMFVWSNGTNFYTIKTVGVTSVIAPEFGGTGVANNAAATLTRSGNHALTLTTSNTTNVTLPTTGTLATLANAETLTNKRINPRVVSAGATSGSLTIDGNLTDLYKAEGLTGAITFLQPSGTPVDGQKLLIRLEDNGTGRGITWTTTSGAFRAVGAALPTTTVANKVTYVGCMYNATDIFWDAVAVVTQA